MSGSSGCQYSHPFTTILICQLPSLSHYHLKKRMVCDSDMCWTKVTASRIDGPGGPVRVLSAFHLCTAPGLFRLRMFNSRECHGILHRSGNFCHGVHKSLEYGGDVSQTQMPEYYRIASRQCQKTLKLVFVSHLQIARATHGCGGMHPASLMSQECQIICLPSSKS